MNYSAILPTRSLENLDFCGEYLLANSHHCNELIVIWNGDEQQYADVLAWCASMKMRYLIIINSHHKSELGVYGMFNFGVEEARSEYVLLINDDMYFRQGWDVGLQLIETGEHDIEKTIISFLVVEPGYVEVSTRNIHFNFGMTIQQFDKDGFDIFAYDKADSPYSHDEFGWFMPIIMSKWLFLVEGGYPTQPEFPFPNDVVFFERLKQVKDIRYIRMNSMVYHFQRLSQRVFDKLNLCCGDDKRDKIGGWVNSDFFDSDHNFDYSCGKIPFEDKKFSQVLFKHALEHFRYEIGLSLLKEIYRILKPGGFVDVHVPNLLLAIEDFCSGEHKFSNCAPAIQRIYGRQESELQVHKSGYTESMLIQALKSVGFSHTTLILTPIVDEIMIRATKESV